MHLNILTERQVELLPLVRQFNRSFYLVGGTAIALYLGHRRSVDFDLFTAKPLDKHRIKKALMNIPFRQEIIFEDYDQLHFMINEVKLTFFSYPYPVPHAEMAEDYISIPTLLSLSAMKAFALGRRAKWKDYVDMFFVLKNHYSINEICSEAESIFKEQFSAKLFREQLAFHKDIDYTEQVEYCSRPFEDDEIRRSLIEKATEIF